MRLTSSSTVTVIYCGGHQAAISYCNGWSSTAAIILASHEPGICTTTQFSPRLLFLRLKWRLQLVIRMYNHHRVVISYRFFG